MYRIKLHIACITFANLFGAHRAAMYDGYVVRIDRLMIIVHKG